jgi:archaellum biogenesis ATPase FlaH
MAGKTGADNAIIIIDSLESLLTYNTEKDVSTLLEDLNNRTETLELDLVLFKQEQSIDEQIGSTLYPLVDEMVLLGEDEATGATVTGVQGDKAIIEIPVDILHALDWGEDEDLSLTVDDNTLTMEPK